jgi:hypothetical protein
LLSHLHCGGLIVVKDCSVRRIPVGFLHVVVVLSPLVAEVFERGFFLTFTSIQAMTLWHKECYKS